MIDFSSYKFRCSQLGEIITPSGKVTKGMVNYLRDLHIEAVYGITKDISSKYFEKGTVNESDGLEILNKALYPRLFLSQNKERLSNDWIEGMYDTEANREIIFDIKNGWDHFTFGNASLSHLYSWQLHGYSFLTGIKKSALFYVLTDMPENLLVKEETSLYYKGKFSDVSDPSYIEAVEELRNKHNYSKLALEERFKVWFQEYTPKHEEIIKNAVMNAREVLMELEIERLENLNKNKKLIENARNG